MSNSPFDLREPESSGPAGRLLHTYQSRPWRSPASYCSTTSKAQAVTCSDSCTDSANGDVLAHRSSNEADDDAARGNVPYGAEIPINKVAIKMEQRLDYPGSGAGDDDGPEIPRPGHHDGPMGVADVCDGGTSISSILTIVPESEARLCRSRKPRKRGLCRLPAALASVVFLLCAFALITAFVIKRRGDKWDGDVVLEDHPSSMTSSGTLIMTGNILAELDTTAVDSALMEAVQDELRPQTDLFYTMSNQLGDNRVYAFKRYLKPPANDTSTGNGAKTESGNAIEFIGSYSTGGSGYPTSVPGPVAVLGSSNSLIQHSVAAPSGEEMDLVVSVNAGSNSVSVFLISRDGDGGRVDGSLQLLRVTKTIGVFPISMAARGDRLCVLSADGPLGIAGNGSYLECFLILVIANGSSSSSRNPSPEDAEADNDDDGYNITHHDHSERSLLYLVRDTAFEGRSDRTQPIARIVQPGRYGDGFFLGSPGGDNKDAALNGPIADLSTATQVDFTPSGDTLVVGSKTAGLFVYPIVDDELTGPVHFPLRRFASSAVRGITTATISSFAILGSRNSEKGGHYLAVTEPLSRKGVFFEGGGVSSFHLDAPFNSSSSSSSTIQLFTQVSDTAAPPGDEALMINPGRIVASKDDGVFFVSNTMGGDISVLTMAADGSLASEGPSVPLPDNRAPAEGISGSDGRRRYPTDLAMSACDGSLYVLDPGLARIVVFGAEAVGSHRHQGHARDPDELVYADENIGSSSEAIAIEGLSTPLGLSGLATAPCRNKKLRK